ncbi:MAG: DUF4097 family beta strand repeat-containing protein [Cyclonatronaceae bacterium]
MQQSALPDTGAVQAEDEPVAAAENDYRMDLRNSAEITVHINIPENVEIRSHAGSELRIESERPPRERPEKAEGLRSLYSQQEDNTNLGLSVIWQDNQVRITSARRHTGEYILHLPNRVRLVYDEVAPGYGGIVVRGHKGMMELSSTVASMELHEVSGPVVAHSQAGNISIRFAELSDEGGTRIQVNAGDIDVSLPGETAANWQLRSMAGDIFTDFDMDIDGRADMEDGMFGALRQLDLSGQTNGGGTEISLQTMAGNIYIRKR